MVKVTIPAQKNSWKFKKNFKTYSVFLITFRMETWLRQNTNFPWSQNKAEMLLTCNRKGCSVCSLCAISWSRSEILAHSDTCRNTDANRKLKYCVDFKSLLHLITDNRNTQVWVIIGSILIKIVTNITIKVMVSIFMSNDCAPNSVVPKTPKTLNSFGYHFRFNSFINF